MKYHIECHIYLRVQMYLFVFSLLSNLGRHRGVSEQINNVVSFKYFWPLWSASSRFWVDLGADHTVFYIKM